MNVRAASARAGFSALELLVVLAVICVLASMAALAVVPSVRRSRVDQAAHDIADVWRQARRLAMQRAPPADDAHYGVVVACDDATQLPYVALILGRPGDGKRDDASRVLLGPDGKPALRHEIAAVASVWLAARELRDTPGKAIAWYAQYRTGAALIADGAGLGGAAAEIGTRPSLRPPRHLVGVATDAEPTSPGILAPGDADAPGLSVRSVDERVRRALAVYASGIALVQEF